MATPSGSTRSIIIVSLAPWARRSLWWRQALLASRERHLPPSAALLLRYLQVSRGDDCGALSEGEATIIRTWASTIPGWRERAEHGQYPLRFHSYAGADRRRTPSPEADRG